MQEKGDASRKGAKVAKNDFASQVTWFPWVGDFAPVFLRVFSAANIVVSAGYKESGKFFRVRSPTKMRINADKRASIF